MSIAILAILAGADSFVAIERYGIATSSDARPNAKAGTTTWYAIATNYDVPGVLTQMAIAIA